MKRLVIALTLLIAPLFAQVPLTDLGSASYLGLFQGGLYEGANYDYLRDRASLPPE